MAQPQSPTRKTKHGERNRKDKEEEKQIDGNRAMHFRK